VSVGLPVSSNASAGPSTHSSASIRYYHVISVGVICFLIGAITSFVVLIHCPRITPAALPPLDPHKPAFPSSAAAAEAVATATAEKRRDVIVTSRGVGGATLQTVIRADRAVCRRHGACRWLILHGVKR